MRHIIPNTVKYAAKNKYAWPGGYPMFVVTTDGGALCVDCVRAEWRAIAHSTVTAAHDGWDAAGSDVNWEDPDLDCDHCGEKIESAYGLDCR